MTPDEAAWVRQNVLNVVPLSIATGATHLDSACDPHPSRKCAACFIAARLAERGHTEEHRCQHGRPMPEGRLRVAGRDAGPRGCRFPADRLPDRIWLAGRTCRTHCTCPCRQAPAPALFGLDEL